MQPLSGSSGESFLRRDSGPVVPDERQTFNIDVNQIISSGGCSNETDLAQMSAQITTSTDKLITNVPKSLIPGVDVPLEEDDDLGIELEIWMKENTIPIPDDDLFAKFNIIVVRDSYEDEVPMLNGMRESEWKKISGWISSLLKKDEVGGIKLVMDSADKQAVIEALQILCTRKVGREIIEAIINSTQECEIIGSKELVDMALMSTHHPDAGDFINEEVNYKRMLTGGISSLDFTALNPKKFTASIVFNPMIRSQYFVYTPQGKILEEAPFFVTLAHELIHVRHLMVDAKEYFSLLKRKDEVFDVIEEKKTISGWIDDPKKIETEHAPTIRDVDGEDWDQTISVNENIWDPLSENGLRSVFNMKPRTDHSGGIILENPDLSLISPDLAEFLFLAAASSGNLNLIQQLLDNGWRSRVFNSNRIISQAFECAAKSDQLEVVKYLETFCVNPYKPDIYEKTILHKVAPTGAMKVVEYLVIEKGLKADALDCINESPLLLVMRKLSTTTEEINKKNLLSVLRFFVQQNYIDYNKIVSVDYKNASYLAFGLIYKLNIEILQLFFEKGARLKNEDITYFCRNFTRYLDETAVAFLESNSLFIFSGIGANERMTMIKELVDCGSQSDIERARRLGLDLTTPLSDGLSPKEFAIGRGKEFFIP